MTAPPAGKRLYASWRRDLLLVGVLALAVRALFALAIGDTYDYDEFVLLLLARDYAHGAVPYHTFMFFHPPGALVILRVMQPLLEHWWQAGRALSVLVDTATTCLVWRIGALLYERRGGLAAGLLYAFSPIALISAARIGQDPLITLLGTAGLAALLLLPGRTGAMAAGVCLGLAIWIKYPAVYFLPVYVAAAPRRTPYFLPAAAVAGLAAVAPFLGHAHDYLFQTVTFQRTRWVMKDSLRAETTLLYWLAANLVAVVALFRVRAPAWLFLGFILGGLFALPSQVYYHYFVPVVPFAALLGAQLLRDHLKALTACGLLLCAGWAVLIDLGGPAPLYVTAAHLSDIQPTIRLLDRRTPVNRPILADRLEYAYLSGRPALADYFWNIGVLVRAPYLERRVHRASAVVLSFGASSGYPRGFLNYLDARYPRVYTPANDVWLVHPGRTRQ